MKQFMDVVRENRALRRRVEEGLMRAQGSFAVAAALMSPEMLEQSLLYPKQSVELEMTFQNVMSVEVPRYQFKTRSQDPGEVYPYRLCPDQRPSWTTRWTPCPRFSRTC